MNREIKFRAWDKKKKKMLFGFENNEVNTLLLDFEGSFWTIDFGCPDGGTGVTDDLELMQFTGLHDKNGKEIYEGDVVKGKNYENFEELAVVSWDYVQWYPLAGSRAFRECEVIGNVFENPELPKQITDRMWFF